MLTGETYQRLIEAFCEPTSVLYQKMQSLKSTSHLDGMIDNPEAVNCHLRRANYLVQTLKCKNKRILDYGSGMGFLACAIASDGAEHVTGVEILEPHRCFSQFMAKDVFNVENIQFVKNTKGLGLESYDIVLFSNVLSHVNNSLKVLLEAADLLRSLGLIFVEDNNNMASFIIRRKMASRWIGAEKCYLSKRVEYIKNLFPEFSKDKIQNLAEKTYGMTYTQIVSYVENYQKFNKEAFDTTYLKSRAPIDPDTYVYHENAFYPQELETILFNAGFVPVKTSAKYVFTFRRHLLVSKIFQRLPKISLNIAPSFEIIAIKK